MLITPAAVTTAKARICFGPGPGPETETAVRHSPTLLALPEK